MPHNTPGLSPQERLLARVWHYLAYTIIFLLVYGGIRFGLGYFPESILLGVLIVSLLKDIYDEYRLRHGRQPLAYAGFEHTPSNVVLIAFLLLGVITPSGTILDVPVRDVALALAVIDLLFDLSQDLRA